MRSITFALSAGDYNGIGPEIIIKSLSDPEIRDSCGIVVFGTQDAFRYTFEQFASPLQSQYQSGYTATIQNIFPGTIPKTIKRADFTPGISSKKSGQAAFQYLNDAILSWKKGECHGIVTAPVMKQTLFQPGSEFHGQTEWIAYSVGSDRCLMIMVKDSFRIALATTHIALRNVAESISMDIVVEKGTLFHQSLVQDFGITKPRIALCGLNPHSGEGGMFGGEEQTILEPALTILRKSGGEWTGPIPSDTLFVESNLEKFDGIMALYHDQGLIPFKMHCGFTGVNFTAGLPLVRTSPDHGVALDISGRGIADSRGLKEAIKRAAEIALCRTASG